jgi:hypothetical protein
MLQQVAIPLMVANGSFVIATRSRLREDCSAAQLSEIDGAVLSWRRGRHQMFVRLSVVEVR